MKTARYTLVLLTAAVSTALISGQAQATNGMFAHGYGTISKGMAGAGSAAPQETTAMATNPAGLMSVTNRLDAGLAYFSPKRSYTVEGEPSGAEGSFGLTPESVDSGSETFFIPSFGYSKALGTDAAWGVAVVGNGGMNTDYPQSAGGGQGTFYAGNTGMNLEQLGVFPTFAKSFADGKASFGISGVFVYQTLSVDGVGSFADFSSDPDNLSNNGTDTSTGFGVKLGVMGEVAEGFTLAASYQPTVDMTEFDKYSGLLSDGGDLDVPPLLTLGLAYEIAQGSTVVFDVQTIGYSEVNSIGNAFDTTALQTQGLLFGADDSHGFGWDDMTVYKLGYEFEASPAMTWRVGYSISENPVGEDDVTLNILAPAVIEQHLSAGMTMKQQASAWNAALTIAPSNSVEGENVLDPVQTIELEMDQVELEVSYSYSF